jgi:molecular chaperone GrpE
MSKTHENEIVEEIVTEETETVDETSEETVEVELTLEEKIKLENEALKEEVGQLKNDFMKAYADTENLRKRLQRDHEQSVKYRIQSFANSVLPALDNLERALAQETSDEGFKTGVQMIYDQIMASLKAEGVEPIDALDKPFDPNIHQAIAMEDKEGVESGIVIEVFQKGYMLKDRILRAAMVKVTN